MVQYWSHTQPRSWGTAGQREKLRTTVAGKAQYPGAFTLEGPLTSRKGLLPLLAFMSTARQAGPLRAGLRSTKRNEPRGTGSSSSPAFQAQASDLPSIRQHPVLYLFQGGHAAAHGATPAWVPSFPLLLRLPVSPPPSRSLDVPMLLPSRRSRPGEMDSLGPHSWAPPTQSGFQSWSPAAQSLTSARCCPNSSTSHTTPFTE